MINIINMKAINNSKTLLIAILSIFVCINSGCSQPEKRVAKYVDLTEAAESSVNAVV